jgi:hypothetical protein
LSRPPARSGVISFADAKRNNTSGDFVGVIEFENADDMAHFLATMVRPGAALQRRGRALALALARAPRRALPLRPLRAATPARRPCARRTAKSWATTSCAWPSRTGATGTAT